jgi:8-oxo-dGTP pyrophosphatase MutT (NUDIX family)
MSLPVVPVASLILENARREILLGRRADGCRYEPRKWDLPGGKIERESPDAAARRELREEFGLAYDGPLESLGRFRFAYPDRIVEACYFRGVWTGTAAIEIRREDFSEGGFVDPATVPVEELAFFHARVLGEVLKPGGGA